jgi:glycosyltransferase involved in cell wall biosynthesis
MASGVPVVSSDASCLPEVAGEATLLVDPSETGELTEGLLRLCEDRELREEKVRQLLGWLHTEIDASEWQRSIRRQWEDRP